MSKPSKQPSTLAAGAGPIVSNVTFTQSPHPAGGSQVVVTYDLVSPEGNCTIALQVSSDGGSTYSIVPQTLEGAVGAGVAAGIGKQIVWRVSTDMPNSTINQARFRVVADDGVCNGCKLWSDPATWAPGGVPADGAVVTVPADWHLILDEDTAALDGLVIEGTLEFARRDLELESDYVFVDGGTLRIGTPENPFTHDATITLTATDTAQSIMGMGTRGVIVMNGALEIHGLPPAIPWTRINDHAPAGATAMVLAEAVDWSPGDQVVLAPTDFHTVTPTAQRAITERLVLEGVSGNSLMTTTGPAVARWGRLQYATATGMSLVQDNSLVLSPEMAGMPTVLDQRAEIGNLTRNVVIQAPDDAAWAAGFGAHVMIMGAASTAHVDGLEIRRGGQRGLLGRYPFHWHMLSYAPPATLADATGHYLRNSTINESMNRGIVVHGTNGILVQDNIVYDVRGHGIFTEDAVERRNTFDGNLVLRVRNPAQADALKLHELEFGSPNLDGGSSGFWISNPDNVITNNVAADCNAFGFWLAFTFQPWGQSQGIQMNPRHIQLDTFADNVSHTTRLDGLMLDQVEAENSGLAVSRQYIPTTQADGIWANPFLAHANRVPFELTRFTVWKSGRHGIWDRASGPQNREIISADNCQKFFSGSGEEGLIERSLVVGTSLNNPTPRPNVTGDPTPSGFATYHSTFDVKNNLVINFPLTPGQTSGAFAEDDFYARPVEKGTVRNTGNVLINSHPGYKSTALLSGTGAFQPFASWFNFAPAKWDPHGYWGTAGNYVVYNTPFLTHGQPISAINPGPVETGAVGVPGPFYGFLAFVLHGVGDTPPQDQDYHDYMEINVRRLDQDLNEVAVWSVAGALPSYNLAHMRSFAAHRDGIYELTFPYNSFNPGFGAAAGNRQHPTRFRMEVENMLTTDDTLVIGIHYDGTRTANVSLSSPGNANVPYTAVADLDAVRASAGATFWQDTTNNRVWVKLRGGTWLPGNWAEFVLTPDMPLYETTYLNITPNP